MTPAWAWPLTILGALGWTAAGATGIVLYAVLTRTHHGPDQAYQTIPSTDEKPPAEGSGHTGAPAQAPPPPGPSRARDSYRAPAGDHGTCLISSQLYDTGICVVFDHARQRRFTFEPPDGSESDAAFLRRIEREVWNR